MSRRLTAVKPIEYSQWGGPVHTVTLPAKASQTFPPGSGKLVTLDSSGYVEQALAADTTLIGGALVGGNITTGSSDGDDDIVVNFSVDATWLLPIAVSSTPAARTEAQLIALLFKTCDLYVASNIQYAHLDASAKDVIQIVDFVIWGTAVGQQAVIVKPINAKQIVGGVA